MSEKSKNQIESWLKKLERESWQLELLVSAFTIFLLIGANTAFDDFLRGVQYQYNIDGPIISAAYIFLILIQKSISALTICLIIHLMLRGFWIGAIGLRSVQSSIEFSKLNYNDFFTEKLKSRVISLDRMVIKLDEICSVIFAFSFLIISVLLAFGMFFAFLATSGVLLSSFLTIIPEGWIKQIILFSLVGSYVTLILAGLLYAIDYFTLGFIKKIKWMARIYYPFYRFYSFLTLANLSRSIYYYLISKFSKKRIRLVYSLVIILVLASVSYSFDQYQYYPENDDSLVLHANYYDDLRPQKEYVGSVSISSQFIEVPYLQVFLRYNPQDNQVIKSNCPDLTPIKEDGLNRKIRLLRSGGNIQIASIDYSDEDPQELLDCLRSIYQLTINDSTFESRNYYFYEHPQKNQKGLMTMLPLVGVDAGENILTVKKLGIDSTKTFEDYAVIPFWYNPD